MYYFMRQRGRNTMEPTGNHVSTETLEALSLHTLSEGEQGGLSSKAHAIEYVCMLG